MGRRVSTKMKVQMDTSMIGSLCGTFNMDFKGKLWIDGQSSYKGEYPDAKIRGTIKINPSKVKIDAIVVINGRVVFGSMDGLVWLDTLSKPNNVVIHGVLCINSHSNPFTFIAKCTHSKLYNFL